MLEVLDHDQRLWLAACALLSLSPETAERLAEAALADLRAGSPRAPFQSVRTEAGWWAEFASPAELKWYLAEIWNRLEDHDRRAFLSRVASPADLRNALAA